MTASSSKRTKTGRSSRGHNSKSSDSPADVLPSDLVHSNDHSDDDDDDDEVSQVTTLRSDQAVTASASITTSGSSESSTGGSNQEAGSHPAPSTDRSKTYYKRFGIHRQFQLSKLFGSNTVINDLEHSDIVDHLLRYCRIFAVQPQSQPLHPVEHIYGHLWDQLSPSDRADFYDSLLSAYSSLSTSDRDLFKPIVTEAKSLVPNDASMLSAQCNRMKLIQLCSAEIPLSGSKLSMKTTPMDLATFRESMLRQVDHRPGWSKIIRFKVQVKGSSSKKKKTYNIIVDFRQFTQDDILGHDFHTTESRRSASLSMYDALSATMSNQFRGEMRLYNTNIDNQGPKLLWFILRRLSLNHDRVKANVLDELHTLQEVLVSLKWDVHRICPVLHSRLMDFKDAGGDITSHYELVCTAFTAVHCDAFTSKVREWEQKQVLSSSGTKCVFELLQEIPLWVDTLVAINQWPHKKANRSSLADHFSKSDLSAGGSKANSKRKADEISKASSDLTAFIGKATTAFEQLAANAAAVSGKDAKRAKIDKGKPNNYKYCPDRWGGPSNHYKTEDGFKTFYYGLNVDKTQVYILDKNKWFWCEKCGRMGNHKTVHHRAGKPKSTSPPPVSSETSAPPLAARNTSLAPPSEDDIANKVDSSASVYNASKEDSVDNTAVLASSDDEE